MLLFACVTIHRNNVGSISQLESSVVFHFAEQGAEYCTLRELEKENKRKYKKTKKTNHKMADPFQYKNTGNPYNQFTEEKLIRKVALLKKKKSRKT